MIGEQSFCALLAGLLIASLCGCTHSKPEVKPQSPPVKFTQVTGDCGEVILRHALLYGAKPTATNGLPQLGPRWSYTELQNGILILLNPDQYGTVESFVLQAFGPPSLDTKTTGPGVRQPAAWLAVPDDRYWKGMYQRHDHDFHS